jgi:hypothetical protein
MEGTTLNKLRWRALAVVLAATLSTTLLSSCDPAPPRLYGTHDDLTYDVDNSRISSVYDFEDAFGVGISRNTLRWRMVQPTPSTFDWSKVDYVVDQATQRGIKVQFVVREAPEWASGSSDPIVVPSAQPAFDAFVTKYKNFVKAAIQRYGDTVKNWELWSEPNENHYWQPLGLSPGRDRERWMDLYAQLYKSTFAYVKGVNSSVKIAIGALTGLGGSCCILGTDFLHGMINRAVPFKVLAINPHAGKNQAPWSCVEFERSFCDIQKIRDILVSRGKANVQLWVSEYGWQVGAFTRTGTNRIRLRIPGDRNRLNLWPPSGQVVLQGKTYNYSSITRTDDGYSDIHLSAILPTVPPNGTQLYSPQAEQTHADYVRAALQMIKGTYHPAAGRPQQNYSYVKVAIYFDNVDKNMTAWGMYGLFRTPVPNFSDPGKWFAQPKPAAAAFHDEVS